MKLRQKEFHCHQCNERRIFTELGMIYPNPSGRLSGNYVWGLESINPYFICSHCDYAEKLEYLEYPSRKSPPSFLKKKWTDFLSNIKRKWEDSKKYK